MEPLKEPLVGRNIQRIRKQQGLTLGVLSEKSGVSKAMLSQIEAEKANPTVATVWKIAQGLGVELNDLLQGSGEAARNFSVTRKDTIMTLDTEEEGIHLQVLSPISMVEDLEMYLLTFKPGKKQESKAHFPRTEEFLTIIKGDVTVTAGKHFSELHEGDFIRYHCDVDHSIENVGKTDALIHMVVRFSRKQWD
jgi:transcriptional regulator with XRE-family HTH domain